MDDKFSRGQLAVAGSPATACLPTAVGKPCTDPHAHLDHVCERLGDVFVFRLLERWDALYSPDADPRFSPFILDIGTMPGDLARRRAKFGGHPCLRFSAGLWPGKVALNDIPGAIAALARDAADPDCSALGECGLDYHHMNAEASTQIELFRAQAELAWALKLPLIVHSRDAFDDTLKVVGEYARSLQIVIHCFSYGRREAEAFLDEGCFISFAGNLTYGKSEPLRDALKIVPPERLLLETDSPYMNPMPLRGKASTPLDVGRTIACAAEVRGASFTDVALQAHGNALRIFSGNAPAV